MSHGALSELAFTAGVKYRGKLYFSSRYLNGLFSYDLLSGETKPIDVFGREKLRDWLHFRAFLVGNEAWFMPLRADHIACVNLDTFEITYVDIPDREAPGRDAFIEGSRIGDDLVFSPRYLHSFVRVDTKRKEASEICRSDLKMDFWSRGFVLYQGKMYVTNLGGEIGLMIDLESGKCEQRKETVAEGGGYYSSLRVDNEAWMIPYDSSDLIRENLDTGERVSVNLGSGKGYYRGWHVGDSVVLMPACRETGFIKVGIEDCSVVRLNSRIPDGASAQWQEINVIDTDDGSFLGGLAGGGLVEYVKDADEIVLRRVLVDPEPLHEGILKRYKECGIMHDTEAANNVIVESAGFAFPEFLYVISHEL